MASIITQISMGGAGAVQQPSPSTPTGSANAAAISGVAATIRTKEVVDSEAEAKKRVINDTPNLKAHGAFEDQATEEPEEETAKVALGSDGKKRHLTTV